MVARYYGVEWVKTDSRTTRNRREGTPKSDMNEHRGVPGWFKVYPGRTRPCHLPSRIGGRACSITARELERLTLDMNAAWGKDGPLMLPSRVQAKRVGDLPGGIPAQPRLVQARLRDTVPRPAQS